MTVARRLPLKQFAGSDSVDGSRRCSSRIPEPEACIAHLLKACLPGCSCCCGHSHFSWYHTLSLSGIKDIGPKWRLSVAFQRFSPDGGFGDFPFLLEAGRLFATLKLKAELAVLLDSRNDEQGFAHTTARLLPDGRQRRGDFALAIPAQKLMVLFHVTFPFVPPLNLRTFRT
jgi:hypothetical protein